MSSSDAPTGPHLFKISHSSILGRDENMTNEREHASEDLLHAVIAAGERHAEATESAEGTSGTEVDYRAAYEALRAESEAYKLQVRDTFIKYAVEYTDACGVLDTALAEVGLTRPEPRTYDVEVTFALRWTWKGDNSGRRVSETHQRPTFYNVWRKVSDVAASLSRHPAETACESYRVDIVTMDARATQVRNGEQTGDVLNLTPPVASPF